MDGKRITILGSTGSIGRQALSLLEDSDDFTVVGLSAGSDWEGLAGQAGAFGVEAVAIGDPGAGPNLEGAFRGSVLAGPGSGVELIEVTEPDLVLNAIVGAAGLMPSVATLALGLPLALANKESLVIAGDLLVPLAEGTRARIIPVDSEHSALDQLLRKEPAGSVGRIVLTASGGPFLGRTDLAGVTPEEALRHPTWEMGGRITIDSATLMNKGFEMIEAHHLFGFPYDSIEVVVHPQSIVHALVELADGAQLAHLGMPDMRVPIAYALSGPERLELPVERLDLAALGSLEFQEVDDLTFPCLGISRSAGEAGGVAPCVLNAADEVAVGSFLGGELSFDRIPWLIESVLEEMGSGPVVGFEELLEVDREARVKATELVEGAMRR